MSEASTQSYLLDFARLHDSAGNNGCRSDWLGRLRLRAIDRFRELGFPTTRNEDWKFTDLRALTRLAFQPAGDGHSDAVSAEQIREFSLGEDKTFRMVFVDGRYRKDLSSPPDGVPDGLEVASLGTVLERSPARIEPHLARYADHENQAFAALNTAFFSDGAYIHVSSGALIERPIHLLFVATQRAEPTVTHPRILIVTGANSRATIVESFVGLGDSAYLTNAITEIVLGEYAVLDHYKVQQESKGAFHIATIQAQQSFSSNFTSHSIALGGRLARTQINTLMNAEGCGCRMNGLYVTDGKRLVDNQTSIDHAKPHCTSQELYKGILSDSSRAIFNGKIIVRPDAQKSDAHQSNKNLILSEGAEINTKPQLEIFASDVRCAHGATVGQLDEEALYYMRSRGIDRDRAARLLTYGFASEVLREIKIAPLRARIEATLFAELAETGDALEVG